MGRHRPAESASILLTVIILLLIGTIIGVSVLSTTMVGQRQVGSYKGRVSLEYHAESGLEAARLRLTAILKDEDSAMSKATLLDICSPSVASTAPATGGVCAPATPTPTPFCPEDAATDIGKGHVTENVICNFLGSSYPKGRVVLVRKDDLGDAVSTEVSAQFLVNVLALDEANRHRVLIGMMTARYSPDINEPPDTTPTVEIVARSWLNE